MCLEGFLKDRRKEKKQKRGRERTSEESLIDQIEASWDEGDGDGKIGRDPDRGCELR